MKKVICTILFITLVGCQQTSQKETYHAAHSPGSDTASFFHLLEQEYAKLTFPDPPTNSPDSIKQQMNDVLEKMSVQTTTLDTSSIQLYSRSKRGQPVTWGLDIYPKKHAPPTGMTFEDYEKVMSRTHSSPFNLNQISSQTPMFILFKFLRWLKKQPVITSVSTHENVLEEIKSKPEKYLLENISIKFTCWTRKTGFEQYKVTMKRNGERLKVTSIIQI
ncbi:MAG: hypothetical protein ABEJ65_05590 [bacterium]